MAFPGAVELLFIVAATDGIGGEAITKRIREQLDGYEPIQKENVTISITHRPLEMTKRKDSESMDDYLEKVASQLQEVMDEEISSRMAQNEQ
jgi:hypothetical protein